MKVLNLGKIGKKETRKLILADVEHVVKEMTVSNFIETTRAAERIEKETSVAVQIEETVAMIMRSVPTASKEDLGDLELETLQAVVAFIRGDEVEGVEQTEEGGQGK